jgi:adenosine deaminase
MSQTEPDWLPILERGLAMRDPAALTAVPKTDLHSHGLLSAPLAVYAQVRGRPLPPPPRVFGDFDRFQIYIVEQLFPALADATSVRAIIRGAFERLVTDGVVYAEMSFDLLLPESIGLSPEQFASMLDEETARMRPRVTVAPELGINRTLPAADIESRVRALVATGAFRSIDLYGDERVGNVRDFAPLYDIAATYGLKRKAHAGELCGAACVRETVEVLHLDAVHHGVRAAEDPDTVDWLAERGVVLHICPTSNYSLGIYASLDRHPARTLFDQGVKLTVNTDDFTLFGASVCDELVNLSGMGFTPAEIAQIIETGLAQRD